MHRVALTLFAVLSCTSLARAYETRHVFITNRGGNNIVELNENFEFERVWFQDMLFDGAALSVQNGMAFSARDELFVADTGNDRIVAFDTDGAFVRAFPTLDRLGASVESIYFDGSGVLYASANPGVGTVARYTDEGMALADVVMAPEFANLGNVNLTEEGNVVVADFSNMNRGIRELDPTSGEVIRAFGTDLGLQEDLFIDGAGRIFVSHLGGNEVVVFGPAPERNELYRFSASAEPGLVRPTGIALTQDCFILVASFENGAIFVFRHQGGDTPPVFDRVLRPGIEIPESAALSLTESIAISGLRLPGGFDEFVDRVPSCDPVVPMDAGVSMDAGADLGAEDAGAEDAGLQDAARPDADTDPSASSGGCSCRVGASSVDFAWLVAFGFLLHSRRRQRV